MFVGCASDHTGNTFKMLNLRTHWVWKSRDVKWIATSIATLPEPKQAAPANDEDDDNKNLVAPVADINEDKEVSVAG